MRVGPGGNLRGVGNADNLSAVVGVPANNNDKQDFFRCWRPRQQQRRSEICVSSVVDVPANNNDEQDFKPKFTTRIIVGEDAIAVRCCVNCVVL